MTVFQQTFSKNVPLNLKSFYYWGILSYCTCSEVRLYLIRIHVLWMKVLLLAYVYLFPTFFCKWVSEMKWNRRNCLFGQMCCDTWTRRWRLLLTTPANKTGAAVRNRRKSNALPCSKLPSNTNVFLTLTCLTVYNVNARKSSSNSLLDWTNRNDGCWGTIITEQRDIPRYARDASWYMKSNIHCVTSSIHVTVKLHTGHCFPD